MRWGIYADHKLDWENLWYWVVFKRLPEQDNVLDSASYLPSSVQTDSSVMQSKWFIDIKIT